MVADAEKFKEDDEKMKANVDARNELESYTYQLKNSATDDKNSLEDEKFSDDISSDGSDEVNLDKYMYDLLVGDLLIELIKLCFD